MLSEKIVKFSNMSLCFALVPSRFGRYVADCVLQLGVYCRYDAKQIEKQRGKRARRLCALLCFAHRCSAGRFYYGRLPHYHFSD